MMDVVKLLLALAAPAFVGRIGLRLLMPLRKPFAPLEEFFLAFGLGAAMVTLGMFYGSLFDIPFTYLKIAVWGLILVDAVYGIILKCKPSGQPYPASSAQNIFWWEKALGCLIAFTVAQVFVRAYLGSVSTWDRWAVWAFKAKVYFLHQSIPFERFAQFSQVWGNWDYPHHVPLLEAWVALHLGYWNEQFTKLVFPVYFSGLGVLMYYFCKQYVSRGVGIAAAFAVLSLPAMQLPAVSGLAEPVLVFYFLSAMVMLLRAVGQERKAFFILSAIFCGAMGWTKQEGMAYALLVAAVAFLSVRILVPGTWAERSRWLAVYIATVLAVIVPQLIFQAAFAIKNIHVNAESLAANVSISAQSVLSGLYALTMRFIDVPFFNLLWLVFFALWLKALLTRSQHALGRFVLAAILLHFVLVLALRAINPTDLYLTDAMGRLLLAPAVLAVLYIALQFKSVQGGNT